MARRWRLRARRLANLNWLMLLLVSRRLVRGRRLVILLLVVLRLVLAWFQVKLLVIYLRRPLVRLPVLYRLLWRVRSTCCRRDLVILVLRLASDIPPLRTNKVCGPIDEW